MVLSQAGIENPYQRKCPYKSNFLTFSAESVGANKQLHLTIPQGQHCRHTVLCTMLFIGCKVAQP
jgi:hypothetical protein